MRRMRCSVGYQRVVSIARAMGVALSLGCKSSAPPTPEPAPMQEEHEPSADPPPAEAPRADAPAAMATDSEPGEGRRALDAVLAELDARELGEQSPEQERAALERDRAARAARAASFPRSDWALMGREGDCAELSSLEDGMPQLRRAPDPFEFAALWQSRGVEATATAIPGTNGDAVDVRVPAEGLGLIFMRRSRCRTIVAR